MKRNILIAIFIIISKSATCDVIFFPYPFTGISYSAELIASLEILTKAKNTTNIWAGCGLVGSIVYPSMKSYGFEAALERRHYFKSNLFNQTFISGYIGCALMSDIKSFSTIGLVPGVKINYKANLAKTVVLEPYISISVPISKELTGSHNKLAFPALTFGARFGFNKLIDKRRKIT